MIKKRNRLIDILIGSFALIVFLVILTVKDIMKGADNDRS